MPERIIGHGEPLVVLGEQWYWLMVGTYGPVRLSGWVKHLQGEGPTNEAAWAACGASLTAEAARYGFTPYWVTKKRPPQSEGFARWQESFFKTFQY